ncbi:hypothetical protein NESM_000930700 [Novymonas esmeraldas]|uniref:Uncharacterized protein n=1 Tax=Novymonas esmeraldas TaxID=1808958 RepID=A0AAW0EYW0_9TRYP
MCLVPPARLSWLQNALSRRNMESSFVADGGGALRALGCANPVAGFVGGLTVALINLFVSLVRDAEIGGMQSGYTSCAEWGSAEGVRGRADGSHGGASALTVPLRYRRRDRHASQALGSYASPVA